MNTIYQGTFWRKYNGHLGPAMNTPRSSNEAERFRRASRESEPVDKFLRAHLDRFERLKSYDNDPSTDLDPQLGSVVVVEDKAPTGFLESLAIEDAYRHTGPAKADSYSVDGSVVTYSQLQYSPESGELVSARMEERNVHIPADGADFDPALVGKRKVTTFTSGPLTVLKIDQEHFGKEGTRMHDTLELNEVEEGIFHLLEQSEGTVL